MSKAIQLTLTPSESKKLISLALMRHEKIARALKDGILAIHPSSTTYFLYKEIARKEPDAFVCGVVVKRGTCICNEMLQKIKNSESSRSFRFLWVFKNGKEIEMDVGNLIEEMGEGDVYVKAPNAIDGRSAGVLIGSPDGIGTAGRFVSARGSKNFHIILPCGIEKMIPSVDLALKASPEKLKYSMGMPVYVRKIDGEIFTEVDAFELLFDVEAIPVASGGLKGAEGSVTFYIEGDEAEIDRIKEFAGRVKGAELPDFAIPSCPCEWNTCSKYGFELL